MKNLNKVLLVVVLTCLFTSTVVYAKSYKLTGDKVPDKPQVYLKDNIGDYVLSGSAETACMQWEENGSTYGIPSLSAGISPYYDEQYSMDSYSESSSNTYGTTYFFKDGTIQISLNKAMVPLDSNIENIKTWHFIINHEIGHCFGLDDLGFWDTRNSVMSYYADKAEVERATQNDYDGVKASYN